MRDSRSIIAVMVIIIAIGIAGVVATGMAGIAMNRHARTIQTSLLDNALSQTVEETLAAQKSVARWDEAARRIQQPLPDREWLNHEIGSFMTSAYGQDDVYILDPSDQPIYAFAGNAERPPAAYLHYAAAFRPLIARLRTGIADRSRARDAHFRAQQHRYARLQGAMYARWDAHVVGVDGHAAVVSAFTIVPITRSDLLLPRPYLLLSVIQIDQDRLDAFSNALLIAGLKQAPLDGSTGQSGELVVKSDFGAPIERLVWSAREPGRVLLRYIVPVMLLAVLLAAVTLASSLRRLNRMNAELVIKEREASFLANYDALSTLPNRRFFSLELERALGQRSQYTGRPAIAFCDLDGFKQVNDTLGHAAGDKLIRLVARRLREAFPGDALIARFGGDEFAIMQCASEVDLPRLGARIQQALDGALVIEDDIARIGISVGIAASPAHGETVEELIKNADIALYRAKDAGRACVVVYEEAMGRELVDRKMKEERLRAALRMDRLELHYQPIVHLRRDELTGVEALLRWPSDDPDPMYPAEFVPIAESAGMMLELGEWVIHRAFADSLRWPTLTVAINLSPIQIQDPALIDKLRRQLRATDADTGRITFEVTEGLLLNATELVRDNLARISALGFGLALDDFGTGYSSLSYLRQFTFDKLKIDRSFIRDGLVLDRRAASLVKAVIDVGRAVGLSVIAEGVEHVAEAHTLRMLGCDEIQGYLCGMPMPAADVSALIGAGGGLIGQAEDVLMPAASTRAAGGR